MSGFSKWIMAEIKSVCINYKSRVGGSKSVIACLDHMARQLSSWADSVEQEPFSFAPHAFIGSIPLQAVCGICGVVCSWLGFCFSSKLFAILSFALFAVTLLLFIFEYTLYCRVTDWAYPKRVSKNVFAVRKAEGETRQRIILCGHADAAYEMPFFLHIKVPFLYVLLATADVGVLVCFVFGLLSLTVALSQTTLLVFGIVEGLLLLAFVPFLFFADWRTVADGANDNLSGCYLGMSILKEMAENGERLKHTDVCCLITDGEESGLRGAMAFAKAHRQELLERNTIVIAADTIHDPEQLMIYHRGINFTQKNSLEVCDLLHRAGQSCGADLPYTDFYPGANDSEAFSREGIKAAAICAVQHTPSTYYHTRFDSWDNLDEGCIELVRNILKAAVTLYDRDCAVENVGAK